ncbi:MAG: class I SAM-dependent methyltransferase [Bacteroidota bacterium]
MSDIAIFSGDRAAHYDDFVSRWIPAYRQIIDSIPGLLHIYDSDAESPKLIVGCGTGNELAAINQHRPDWKLVGIDPSPEMVMQARARLNGIKNIEIKDARIEDLDTEHKFGAATLLLVLHFIPDDGNKLDLLKEIGKRLNPGAALTLVDIYGSSTSIDKQLQMLKGMLLSENDEATLNERLVAIKERIQYISEDRLAELLREAGFSTPAKFFQAAIYGGWVTRKVA